MRTQAFVLPLFLSPGIALPVFPTARPYLPSGFSPSSSITTNARIVPRELENTEDEVLTAPIPDKWKHTHGALQSSESEAEELSVGDLIQKLMAAIKGAEKETKDKLDDDNNSEELRSRNLSDCELWMVDC